MAVWYESTFVLGDVLGRALGWHADLNQFDEKSIHVSSV